MSADRFIRVEYDRNYVGGDYSGVGDSALIPTYLLDRMSVEDAFQKVTDYDPMHIIHYSEDELYDIYGNLVEDE